MSVSTHHVLPALDGGWSVKKGGASRASKVFDTKDAAEKYARKVSISQKTELVIHRRDGTIQRKDSHARDPLPPRDQR